MPGRESACPAAASSLADSPKVVLAIGADLLVLTRTKCRPTEATISPRTVSSDATDFFVMG